MEVKTKYDIGDIIRYKIDRCEYVGEIESINIQEDIYYNIKNKAHHLPKESDVLFKYEHN